jgi:hypothetical protein
MADFFSQFQVHPPNDFPNLGGFQPAPSNGGFNNSLIPTGPNQNIGPMPLDSGFGVNDIKNGTGPNPYDGGNAWSDPRVTTQPQPYQQGPVEIPHAPSNGGIYNPTTNPGGLELPPGPYGDTVIQGPGGYQMPPWLGQGPATGVGDPNAPKPPFTPWSENTGMPPGWTPPAPSGPLPDWMQKKPGLPTAGGWLGGGLGATLGPVAQWMQGNNAPIEQQMAQTNGVSPAALQSLGQPMNPSQQSGMVLMRSPDGMHMQQVPQAHVNHYTGLGATQVTGPQLTGSSYGGGNGQ